VLQCKKKGNYENACLLPNYKGKRHVARTINMCDELPKAVHIFFGSAMGPLDLALGTVATRAGGV
jgi:hypothetical protein